MAHELDGVPIGRIYELVDELRAANKNLTEANQSLQMRVSGLETELYERNQSLAEYEEKLEIAEPIKGRRITLEQGERLIIDGGFW